MIIDKSNIHKYISGTILDCSELDVTSIEDIPDYITSIICQFNNLTSLPKLPSGLISLDCRFGGLKSLPMLPDSLVWLECGENNLTSYSIGDPHSGYPEYSDDKQWMIDHNNRLKFENRINIINKVYENR